MKSFIQQFISLTAAHHLEPAAEFFSPHAVGLLIVGDLSLRPVEPSFGFGPFVQVKVLGGDHGAVVTSSLLE